MAATARLMAVINISIGGVPLIKPIKNITAQIAREAIPSVLPSSASLTCSGVIVFSSSIMEAILPISVFIPVPATTIFPLPYTTVVPVNTMFSLSPIGTSLPSSESVCFSTGTDSPVREDSLTLRFATSTSRPSAGTKSPASISTISPWTSSLVGITKTLPSLITLALGLVIFFKAFRD